MKATVDILSPVGDGKQTDARAALPPSVNPASQHRFNQRVFRSILFALVIGFIGFVVGCIFTVHWMLGVSLAKAASALWHGLDDGFRF